MDSHEAIFESSWIAPGSQETASEPHERKDFQAKCLPQAGVLWEWVKKDFSNLSKHGFASTVFPRNALGEFQNLVWGLPVTPCGLSWACISR